jgi:hypothetical protein
MEAPPNSNGERDILAIPVKVKQQLEEVVAGFVGKVAVSLASAGARLLPRRNLDSGLTRGRLRRSATVRISSYFRSL